jgi:putative DNA primase/helicase
VFPLVPSDKRPLIPKDPDEAARHGWDGPGRGCLDGTTDDDQIARWWGHAPRANIGLHCGPGSGMWVLDVDADKGGPEALEVLQAAHGPLPKTLVVESGGGGFHFYFRAPKHRVVGNRVGVRGVDGERIMGLDVRSEGGYVVLPPSTHPSGKHYVWASSNPIVDAPEWLLDLVGPPKDNKPKVPWTPPPVEAVDINRRYAEGALRHACERIAGLTDGRRAALVREAYTIGGYVGAGILDAGKAEQELVAAGFASGTRHDVRRAVAYGLETGARAPRNPPEPRARDNAPNRPAEARPASAPDSVPPPPVRRRRDYHMSDLGNAHRFVDMHGARLRQCATLPGNGWLIYQDGRWVLDDSREIARLAKDVPSDIAADAAEVEGRLEHIDDPDEREDQEAFIKALYGWARRSESSAGMKALVEVASSEQGIPVRASSLDVDPDLLNCPNGTADLKTGEFRPHDPKDLITEITAAPYDESAPCPTWRAFLLSIMGGDEEMLTFLQKAVGYSLTGRTSEQCLFILHGSGANGKSTFVNALRYVLGTYAKSTSAETFLAKREGAIPNDVAALAHARLVTAAEGSEGRQLDEALIKQVTGGDPVPARFLNKEWFEYTPKYKIWFSTNHRPVIKGTDHGIWRRLRLIPFEVTIPPDQRDDMLPQKLQEEAAGILRWAIEGAMLWREYGLKPPLKVIAATDEYRNEMDVVAHFLAECCTTGGESDNSELYRAYEAWCRRNGERPRTHRWVSRALKDKGYQQHTPSGKGRHWKGITILGHCRPTAPGFTAPFSNRDDLD